MRLSENRTLAFIVLAVVCIGSILVQGGYAMQNQRGDIEEAFMTGEAYESVSRCGRAGILLSQTAGLYLAEDVSAEYASPAAAEALKSGGYTEAAAALEALSARLTDKKQTPDPNAVLAVLSELSAAAEKTYSGIGMLNLSDEQLRDIKLAYYDLNGALDVLSHDGEEKNSYTQRARRFNRDLRGFPAALFAEAMGIEPLTTIGG